MRVVSRLRPSTRSSAGFTLFELIIVMLIVAITGAMVAPAVSSGWHSRQVRQGARHVAGVMRNLRERAVRRGVEQTLVIDADGVTLHGPDGHDSTLPDGVLVTDVKAGWRDADGSVRVTFYPNGGSSGLGVIVARGPHEGLQFAVEVEPLLGSVTIREVGG
ncbi:MAG TPA: GspH/FimT family pseudopilin [Candidatus Binatia bacterium]